MKLNRFSNSRRGGVDPRGESEAASKRVGEIFNRLHRGTGSADTRSDLAKRAIGWLRGTAKKKALLGIVAVVVVGGLITARAGRSAEFRLSLPDSPQVERPQADSATASIGPARSDEFALSQILGSEKLSSAEPEATNWKSLVGTVILRLLLAAGLAAVLAFRGHRSPSVRHNPHVAETQILLAVVASALMMIVADSAARAFGIFAAASLVRFRTNIRDPKEITVLLINLAIGLAAGVGKWELALVFSGFVLATLWVLDRYESGQIVRSMQLRVRTHNVAETDEALQSIFREHALAAEIRELDREDEADPVGRIVYHVAVTPRVSTDQLSEEIFASDQENIDTIEWHQKKNVSYAYR
jgi:uncharacterized membrane protein YhiD involved in acid resistance